MKNFCQESVMKFFNDKKKAIYSSRWENYTHNLELVYTALYFPKKNIFVANSNDM